MNILISNGYGYSYEKKPIRLCSDAVAGSYQLYVCVAMPLPAATNY